MAQPNVMDIPIEENKAMIKTLKNKIASFPSDIDPRIKAQEQFLVGVGEDIVEKQLEKERMNAVLAKHEELYPPNQIECPICLEDVRLKCRYSAQFFPCCGQNICMTCAQSKGGQEMTTCPMCRSPKNTEYSEHILRLKKSADRGVAAAQCMLGACYLGFADSKQATNVEEGIRLMQLAAEQGDPNALASLTHFQQLRLFGLERSPELENKMLTKAAHAGLCVAQTSLAWRYSREEDYTMAVTYATLACRATNHDNMIHPAQQLGKFFYNGVGGLEKNLYIAKFYLELAEKFSNGNTTNHLILAKTLLELSEKNYGTRHPPAGYSSIPRVLHLLNKAIDRDEDISESQELIKELEIHKKCANCGREAESMHSKKLKQCAVCEAVSYCSRDCQVKHWKDGHKKDCVKKYRPLEGIARFLPPGASVENMKNATFIGPNGEKGERILKSLMEAYP